MNLSETTKLMLEKQSKAEKERRFNDHLDDPYQREYIPVDESFSYNKVWYQKIGYFFIKKILISSYAFVANHHWLKTKVIGKSNLNGIQGGAIITSNHVNKLDTLAVGYALGRRTVHTTVAEFNNMKNKLGSCMRAYGIMPIPSKSSMMSTFENQLKKYLDHKDWVHFFPEGSAWWCYEKPRPYHIGAFHYAAKYNVPIIPIFITFKKTNQFTKEGIEKRRFIVHILRPIYPNTSLDFKERKIDLKNRNEAMIWDCYYRFYENKNLL